MPQGQISTTASGLVSRAALKTASKKPGIPSTASSGEACRWEGLWQGGAPFKCWPSILSPSKPHCSSAFRTKARASSRTGANAGQR